MPSRIGFALIEQPFQSPPEEICVPREMAREVQSPESSPAHAECNAEERLILACARTVVDTERAQMIRGLAREKIDWSYLIRTASRNGVMPLVCLNLMRICADLIPTQVLTDCRKYWREHTWRNLHLTAELIRVVRLLDSNNILALPLKGPILAAHAYRDLSLREFCDLDILAPKRSINRIIGLLTGNGYKVQTSPTWLQRLPTPASGKKDYGLISDDGKVRIELHWRLSGTHFDLPVRSRDLWAQLESLPIAGYPIRSLPTVGLLLYLTMHGSRHGWERLQWVCDIAELLQVHQDLDWTRVWAEARTMRNERNLALGLGLAHELLDLNLPRVVRERIGHEPTVADLTKKIRTQLFAEQPASLDISYWHHYHLRVKERMRDRVKLRLHYCARYMQLATNPTANDHALLSLPPSLSFLYYVLRPIRLAATRGTGLIRWIRKAVDR
jgi:Uncharacterised nucleotidyltransferase